MINDSLDIVFFMPILRKDIRYKFKMIQNSILKRS